jgi:DNA polymerase III subunit epsilon
VEEFLRNEIEVKLQAARFLDVQKIFYLMEPRTLTAAYKFYCGKNLDDAHSAEADVQATWEVLEAQLDRYPQLGNTIESILKTVGEDDIVDYARRLVKQQGKVVFNFGKHKGKEVEEVFRQERSYYDWMMQGDFPLDTKQRIKEILHKMTFQRK